MHGSEATGLGDPQGRGYREERGGPSPALRGTPQPPAHPSCRPKCKCNIKSPFPSSAQGRRLAACRGQGLWPRGQLLSRLSICPGCTCRGGSEVFLCSPLLTQATRAPTHPAAFSTTCNFQKAKAVRGNEKGRPCQGNKHRPRPPCWALAPVCPPTSWSF